jgi:hypothetical protein
MEPGFPIELPPVTVVAEVLAAVEQVIAEDAQAGEGGLPETVLDRLSDAARELEKALEEAAPETQNFEGMLESIQEAIESLKKAGPPKGIPVEGLLGHLDFVLAWAEPI